MHDPYKIRASSWGALFDCAHKWEGIHLLGMRSPSSARAALGTSVHAGTAAFDAARVAGTPISADDAAQTLVDKLQELESEVDWSGDDLSKRDAEVIALKLHTTYCLQVSPKYDFRAVELTTLPFNIDCGDGMIVQLTGQLDRCRVRASNGGLGISDIKTGAAAVEKGSAKIKGHAAQLGTYELLFEHTTGERITEPGEIIGMKTKGTLEIASGTIPNARRIMVGTEEHPGLIQFAAEMFRSGLFPPNPQSNLCSAKYCPRHKVCPYHE